VVVGGGSFTIGVVVVVLQSGAAKPQSLQTTWRNSSRKQPETAVHFGGNPWKSMIHHKDMGF